MANRSAEPLPGIKHGAYGYDKGCGCMDCRRANRLRKSRANAKAAAEKNKKVVDLDHQPGQFVSSTRAFIERLAVAGEEAKLLSDLMLFNARLLDNIAATGERWHLSGTTQKTLLELKAQLRRLKDVAEDGKPAGGGGGGGEGATLEGFLGGLTTQN